jgi:Uma2 family endonuclease
MVATTKLLTYEDLLETPDDGRRYEIIGGRLIATAWPLLKHQRVVGRLFDLLIDLEKAKLGVVFMAPTDVRLESHEIVVPDLVFITIPRLDILRPNLVDGAPDLIIEIRSPATAALDDGEKRELYARAGVAEYWRVDPDAETVLAARLVEGRYLPIPSESDTVRSVVAPQFVVDVAALFAGLR